MTPDDGIIGWKTYNERWDSQSTQWNAPADFVSPSESVLHLQTTKMGFRYSFFLYYALINVGIGEICPVNHIDFVFLAVDMIFSAIFFSILFSEIVSLYS